jgi:hypothetical protein
MRFKNISGVPQVLRMPSNHFVKNESGSFWDNTARAKILEPSEIFETSNENDVAYLRRLSAPVQVKNRKGEVEKKPGFFVEIES